MGTFSPRLCAPWWIQEEHLSPFPQNFIPHPTPPYPIPSHWSFLFHLSSLFYFALPTPLPTPPSAHAPLCPHIPLPCPVHPHPPSFLTSPSEKAKKTHITGGPVPGGCMPKRLTVHRKPPIRPSRFPQHWSPLDASGSFIWKIKAHE